ncbi:MAG: SGNH/GDSL hydrolase family protein, partial [Malacoplasma sp.]|nr:SGNH/GDSL hydrolase family protein [Malacoplasma sp.]
TWVFTGGNDLFPNWNKNRSFKNLVGLFEENVRSTMANTSGNNPANLYTSFGRLCINVSKPNQTLKDINNDFNFKIKNLDPKNVVFVVGSEYGFSENIDLSLKEFEIGLTTFVNESLKLRENTSNLVIIKHWKIPNPNQDAKIDLFNKNISRFNNRVNLVLSKLTEDLIPRVVVVDDENIFTESSSLEYEYVDTDFELTRIGSDEIAKSILKTIKPWNKNTNSWWDESYWTDYSKTHLKAQPLEWNTLGIKNGLSIKLDNIDIVDKVATLKISFPEGGVKENDSLNWMFEYTNLGENKGEVKIKDSAVVKNNSIIIDNINLYENELFDEKTTDVTNDFTLTVFDNKGEVFNKVKGNLNSDPKEINRPEINNADSQDENNAKTRFLKKFNDKSKPMVWSFIGDSIVHGNVHNKGFDSFPENVQKNVFNDWKRYDDIFINCGQSGNFTNRATDKYLIHSSITKYNPDVISIGLGINDGVSNNKNGQKSYSNAEQYTNNIVSLVKAAIENNPDVVIVVNAILPTYGSRNKIPVPYNQSLKNVFAPENGESEFKNNVIFNEDSYTELNKVLTNYTFTNTDQLTMVPDKLHPCGNGHFIEAKTFLNALGVDVSDSYISNYMLEEFSWFKGSESVVYEPIKPDTNLSKGNLIAPDIKKWSDIYPVGKKSDGENILANTFLKYENSNGRTYYLNTNYKVYENNYRIFLEDGDYTYGGWAVPTEQMDLSKTEYFAWMLPDDKI